MKTIFLIMMSALLMGTAKAEQIQPALDKAGFQSQAFMTNIDRLRDSTSNITIQNMSGALTFTLTGIFIQQLFQANCTISYHDNHGYLYGTMWSDDISLAPSASTPLGAGYLYSMMMNYLYEAAHHGGPTPATKPGNGTGPGAEPRAWCIQLGILQGAPATYPTAAVSPNPSPSASLSNVVTWTSNTNPTPIAITCDDVSQTCTAATTTQGFPS